MYSEENSQQIILDRLLNNTPSDVDKSEGSFIYDAASPVSNEIAQAYINMDVILDKAFAKTSYGKWLDMISESHGVPRIIGNKSTGQVTFTGKDNTSIYKNTVVQTKAGLRFITDKDVVITNGSASVTITAEDIGSKYNVPASSIDHLTFNINGITSINNDDEVKGGTDTETDDYLRSRLLEKVQNPPSSGNMQDYKRWAKEVSGVKYVKVVPLWNGNGTVKLIVSGENGAPLDETVLQNVKDYIDPHNGTGEGKAPMGANVTIVTSTQMKIDVNILGLSIKDGYELSTVKSNIQAVVNKYLNGLNPGSVINYNSIRASVTFAEGVSDFINVTVNSETANINTSDEQKSVLNTITYS
ncbi:baseplate J/gp47 family protein [Clostridium sp. AWRP]|uniref:baseplate J/gp47 family protein n=1 Tax=Clostridium sp. AWRP TaxID=2212991 RepID=UPI000FDC6FAC|nr:baseplate J/gp47 family protein [Clostridium sp. AWRP]AZV57916.1 baseplate J/gp47 family protein [Clostridium sp. AWRP]